MIESSSNAQIKFLAKLMKKPKTRYGQGMFIAEGLKLTAEAAGLGLAEKLYMTQAGLEAWRDLTGKCRNRQAMEEIAIEVVAESVFSGIADTVSPQGVLALVRMPFYEMEAILSQERADLNLLFLEEIRDPGNLGTIFRTAECANVNGIILSSGCVDIFNPKSVRATMGAVFRMPFVYVEDFILAVKKAQERQIRVYGAHLGGERNFFEENYCGRTAFIIGNEANGMTEQAKLAADTLIKIPMEGGSESLNASIAAAVMMYEAYRQKSYGLPCMR